MALCLAWLCISSPETGAASPCEPPKVARHVVDGVTGAPAPDSLTVASFNIHGGYRIIDPLVAWVESRALDVVVLQEVGNQTMDGDAIAMELAGRLGFHAAYVPTRREEGFTQGLAMLSRYPLDDLRIEPLPYHNLRFRSRCRVALSATVLTGAHTVRVVNLHLDTRINSGSRVAQLGPVLERLREDGAAQSAAHGVAPGLADGVAQIVAGDFNTITVGWWQSTLPLPFAQHQGAAVSAAMTAEGFVTPFGETRATFKFAGLPLRLDWIYLKRLAALDWSVDDVPFSDHRGIWTRVALGPPL